MNEMDTTLTATPVFRLDGLAIPDGTTQEEWLDLHRQIIIAKRASGKWLVQSRNWATDQWGADYAGPAEAQLEFALGIETAAPKPSPNPQDKSRGIVTIEGIAQSFDLWHRKVAPEIAGWGRDKLERALELLEPIARQAEALRAILKGGGGSVDNYASRGVQNDSERS
jgi:hypothetical protein